jgi:hypothetical protein
MKTLSIMLILAVMTPSFLVPVTVFAERNHGHDNNHGHDSHESHDNDHHDDDSWDDEDEKWLEREKRYCENLKAHLSSEEKQRMEKSHRWSWSDNPDRDSECIVCGLSEHGMYIKPQYCDKEL